MTKPELESRLSDAQSELAKITNFMSGKPSTLADLFKEDQLKGVVQNLQNELDIRNGVGTTLR